MWKSLIVALLYSRLRGVALGFVLPLLNLTKNSQKEYTLIQKSLNYILTNFSQPGLSLESLSESIGVTKNHISASFSHNLGMGFNQYLNNVRLNYALELMGNTGQSITEIAFACGFETLRTFNRVFKKSLEMTPSEFRKLQKAGGEARIYDQYV